MNFKRKQRVKGRTTRTYKEWYDETKQYRINWRNEVYGVRVTPCYYACVRCVRSLADSSEYWGFVGRRGPYKTLKAAKEACERNRKAWEEFLAIEGRDKVSQVRALRDRATIGTGKNAHSALTDLAVWVTEQAHSRLLEILCGKT